MRYEYKCKNDECVVDTFIVTKPMDKSSSVERCRTCTHIAERVFSGSIVIKTGDGIK